jgi:hypothetical protein
MYVTVARSPLANLRNRATMPASFRTAGVRTLPGGLLDREQEDSPSSNLRSTLPRGPARSWYPREHGRWARVPRLRLTRAEAPAPRGRSAGPDRTHACAGFCLPGRLWLWFPRVYALCSWIFRKRDDRGRNRRRRRTSRVSAGAIGNQTVTYSVFCIVCISFLHRCFRSFS